MPERELVRLGPSKAPPDDEEPGAVPTPQGQGAIDDILARLHAEKAAAIREAFGRAAKDGDAGRPPATPLEDQVDWLRREAARLRLVLEPHGGQSDAMPPAVAEAIGNLSKRLDGLADRLATRDHLIVITDRDGNLRYGNRRLHDRLERNKDRDDALERLRRELAALPGPKGLIEAKALSPGSVEAQRNVLVEVQRTVLHDEDEAPLGYFYILRNSQVRRLSPGTAELLETVLPQITLHALIAQHSTDGARAREIRVLQEMIYRLEVAPG